MKQAKVMIAVATHYSRSCAFESFLKEAGYDVRVVTRDMSNKFNFSNFFREIFSWRPDLVHIINDPEVMVLLVSIASKLSGAKVIYDCRGKAALYRRETRGTDIFYFAEWFSEIFGRIFYDRKITPIYSISKKEHCALIPQTLNTRASPAPLSKAKKHIVFTSCYFSNVYGIDTLIDSMEYILGDIELWIFGEGIEKEKFEAYARKDTRIKIFGHVPYEEYLERMRHAAVCIIPFSKMRSTEDASPYSVLKLGEFTFFNKPIVCADVGDMRLAEENGVVFYEAGNPKDLAEKITGQIKNPKKTTFFEELGREKVKKKYLDIVRDLLQKQ